MKKKKKKAQTYDCIEGFEQIESAVEPFTIALAEQQTGIPAESIRELSHQFAQTKNAVIYGRMGISVQRFGALCQWAIQVLNILTGHLDVPGGSMFSLPAVLGVEYGAGFGVGSVWMNMAGSWLRAGSRPAGRL